MKLFHVSESPDIKCFTPRPSPSKWEGITEPVVWAVDEEHLVNYLLPRDCPRVTFYPLPNSAPADIKRLIGTTGSKHIVCIEESWLDRVSEQKLCVYELSTETFTCVDSGAGYFVSAETVKPKSIMIVDSLINKIRDYGADFRVLPSLWELSDDVISSSLQFSCIRMRNASPRDAS